MKKIINIVVLFFVIVINANANTCDKNYNCIQIPDDKTGLKIHLQCTLPNMPSFPITIENALSTGGGLRDYFGYGAKNACDVLGWMNGAVPFLNSFQGLNKSVKRPLTIEFKHLPKSMGGATFKNSIVLDSDTYDAGMSEFSERQDGNRHFARMQYITVHEFLHFISNNSPDDAVVLLGIGADYVAIAIVQGSGDANAIFVSELWSFHL